MKRISCDEMEALIRDRALVVVSSCTDLDAQFHSAPQVDTTWGLPDGTEVIRSHRYPAWLTDEPWPSPDRKPCEHYLIQGDDQ